MRTWRGAIWGIAAAILAAQASEPSTERLVWETRLPGVEAIRSLAVDAEGNIYATGTAMASGLPIVNAFRPVNDGMHIAASANGGASWTALANLPSQRLRTLALDPTGAGTLYAGTHTGIYGSTDGGNEWKLLLDLTGFRGSGAASIVVDPRRPRTLYAAGDNFGVVRSTDGGATWASSNNGLPTQLGHVDVNFLVIDPFHPETLLADHFRSDDGGASWQRQDLVAPQDIYRVIAGQRVVFDPVRPDVVYSFAGSRLARSRDRGRTWTALNVPAREVMTAAPDPVTAGVIYAGTDEGLLKSSDDGNTWRNIGPAEVRGSDAVRLIALDPANPSVILAFAGATLWRSADRGQTWRRGTLSRSVSAVVFDRRGRLWVAAERTADGFLMKRSPSGELLFSTYLGGQGTDQPSALAVDRDGNMYVGGLTYSTDFPATEGALQTAFAGARTDGFVMKVNAGGTVAWATYLGGPGDDAVKAIALDGDGNLIAAGTITSSSLLIPGLIRTLPFVTKISPDGSRELYSTRFDESGASIPAGLAVDAAGNAYVVGGTGFLVKIAPDGTVLDSPYLGGSGRVVASAVAVDASGHVYVAGSTDSEDFPTTEGAYQTGLHAGCPYPSGVTWGKFGGPVYHIDDIFVTKFDASGARVWSTLLGGNCYDTASAIALDAEGEVFVAGSSNSSPFPTAYPVEDGPPYSEYKAVIARLHASGAELRFSSHVSAGAPVLALDAAGDLYLGGSFGYLARFTRSSPPPQTR